MRKPVYLYITPFFPSPESWRGGYCQDAAKALVRDGRFDVRVIVPGRGDDYEWDGVKVLRMQQLSVPCGLVPFALDWWNNRIFKSRLMKAGIQPSDVAVCHANTLGCGHYAAFFKRLNPSAKAVVQLHSSYSLNLASGRLGVLPIHATLLYLYYRRIVEGVDALAFVSKMSRDTFGRYFVGAPEGEIRDVRSQLTLGRFMRDLNLPRQMVVYNGIDRSLFSPDGRTAHSGFVIGCVANFQPLKDHITLLRAARLLKDKIGGLKVRLIGSGATLQSCKKYVAENALDEVVTFEPEIDHRDLPDFYRSLDLFVLPSRLEGFVCVCVESWACGTPSIFCESISLAELVPDAERHLWTFKPQDAEDLAAKIVSYRESRHSQRFTKDLEISGIWKDFLNNLNYSEG